MLLFRLCVNSFDPHNNVEADRLVLSHFTGGEAEAQEVTCPALGLTANRRQSWGLNHSPGATEPTLVELDDFYFLL